MRVVAEASQGAQVSKSNIRWQCRRGRLELDLVLERFLAVGFEDLSDADLTTLRRLLACSDEELMTWLVGGEPVDDLDLDRLVRAIRAATGF